MIDYLKKFRLDGKIAFVIGGLGLIGKEVCKAFSLAGAKVIILDIDKNKGIQFCKLLKNDRLEAFFIEFNCEDLDSLETKYYKIIKEFGSNDIFINCSYPRTKDWGQSSFKSITLSSFRKNVDIHMNSYAWLARLAAESMLKNNQGGSIIQLGSIYGVLGQDLSIYKDTKMHENMTYSAIKGGITNLTRLMASYYGRYNIRINTLIPGGLSGHVAGSSDEQDPTFVRNYSNKNPLKRLGRADEIASTALFLASDGSSYITGADIIVDGGWSSI